MKIKLKPITTACHDGENRVYSAKVYVDGNFYGKASDCDLGRWIICYKDASKMEWLDGCYPADSIEALAYAIAECADNVKHGDVEIAA